MTIQADTIPRYAPPTPAELDAMFGDMTTLCDTCRHRGVWCERTQTKGGFARTVRHEFCCEDMEELTPIKAPVDECTGWEMWDA